jgi:hypothetical protein
MTDNPEFDLETLSVLAGKVRRQLHWAAFLVLVMAGIVLIDLQLKRAIAGQATALAAQFTHANSNLIKADQLLADLGRQAARGRHPGDPADGSAGDPDRDRADVLGGTAAVAAGADGPDRPEPAPRANRAPGARQRAAGDGPRAGRGTGK